MNPFDPAASLMVVDSVVVSAEPPIMFITQAVDFVFVDKASGTRTPSKKIYSSK